MSSFKKKGCAFKDFYPVDRWFPASSVTISSQFSWLFFCLNDWDLKSKTQILGVMRMDSIKNQLIGRTVGVRCLGDKSKRCREHNSWWMLEIKLPGLRGKGEDQRGDTLEKTDGNK